MIAIGEKWLVVADVDGTLLGDEDAWSGLTAVLAGNPHVAIVPNSSRHLASLHRSWQELDGSFRFPAQVGALGTEVSIGDEDVGWSDRFRWFDRNPVDRAMASMGYETNGEEFQTPLKASFAVPSEQWERAAAALKRDLLVEIVTSGTSDFDVIPEEAGKAAPIAYLADQFAISLDRVVAVGDSMNDLTMLMAAPHRIVVANAESALIRSTRGSAFHSTRTHARGVAEGLRALGLLT